MMFVSSVQFDKEGITTKVIRSETNMNSYISKVPHSKLWGITGKGAAPPKVTGRGRFHPPSELRGIQRRIL